MNWWLQSVQQPDVDAKQQAEQHQLQLTKPTGALGDLELIAVKLASLQSNAHPHINHPWITVLLAIMAWLKKISLHILAVTRQMLQNFTTGGAAISVIAKYHQAHLQVIDCGTGEAYEYVGVERHCIRAGTANFAKQAAMNADECRAALELGKQCRHGQI